MSVRDDATRAAREGRPLAVPTNVISLASARERLRPIALPLDPLDALGLEIEQHLAECESLASALKPWR